jgi:hypothetical protein
VKIVVNLWWNSWKSLVAIQVSEDVHYLGLELSEFRLFSGREASNETICFVSPKKRITV